MSRKEFIFNVLQSHEVELAAMGVRTIGIFGSIVRGDANRESDYDILVEFKPGAKTFQNFNQLCDLLEQEIGENFDLVTKEGLSPYIGPRILQEVEYVPLAS